MFKSQLIIDQLLAQNIAARNRGAKESGSQLFQNIAQICLSDQPTGNDYRQRNIFTATGQHVAEHRCELGTIQQLARVDKQKHLRLRCVQSVFNLFPHHCWA